MIADVKKTTEQKMDKTLEALKADLGKVRTGRAHTGMLDHMHGRLLRHEMPLNQVANVTLLDARTIGVTPWEKKMVAGDREGDPRFRPRAESRHRGRHRCACRCRRSPKSAARI